MTWLRRVRLAALLLIAVVVGCKGGCRRAVALAELEHSTGTVDRDHAAQLYAWSKAVIGAEFFEGDGIRTGPKASAVLRLDDGSRAALGESTIVRFLSTAPGSGEHGLDVVSGEAILDVGGDGMKLRTSVGLARLESNSRIRLGKTTRGVRFEVLVGKAEVDAAGGPRAIASGTSIEVGVGDAVLEPAPSASAVPLPPAASASSAPDESGEIALEVSGKGVTAKAPGAKSAQPLDAGSHSVAAGSSISVPAGSSAVAARGGQRATLNGAGHYVVGELKGSFVRADAGRVGVDHASDDVTIAAPGGVIVSKSQSSSSVVVKNRNSSNVSVSAGEAEVRTDRGTETLHAGEQADLRAGAKPEIGGRGPGYSEITIGAGESLSVHDPKPPTAVGINFDAQCKQGAIVELYRGSAKMASSGGEHSANLLVPAGSHPYRVRCLDASGVSDGAVAHGTIAVLHDSGTAPLPKSAPLNVVDVDGRAYTVLYQNQLPNIDARWRAAPAGADFTLEIAGATHKVVHASEPLYHFKSGDLAEGTTRLTFTAGGNRSPTTSLVIRFDNAAPTAHITAPANGSFAPGASVTVSGVALPGWNVSVQGKTLEMDAQSRFSGEAVAPPRALVIRFAHPGREVRYYLRRAAGVAP